MSMQRKHRAAEVGPRGRYEHLGDLVLDISEILRPPERLTPSEAAARYRYLNNPGSYVGPWKNETTAYMVEPVDLLTSREYGAIVFVGPAQCGKTDTILLNPIIYGAVCDPMDMLVYQTSQTMAADFSRRRIDRMIRQNDCLNSRLMGGASADTTFNKTFRSGMMVTLSWPTINELSGRPVGRVFLTDYDRMPQDIDGEGSPFDLARKRTTTFGRVGKTFVESSPGFVQKDPQWQARSLHEAPPAEGILALYNRGDRRRWYWQCRNCGEWFEPCFALITYPNIPNPVEAGEQATLECPHCACQHQQRDRYDLNVRGKWLRDGLRLDRDGREVGTPVYSDIASFWLKGAAAAFASWGTLVKNYLLAVQEYDRTGSQEALKATVNTDQGEPYLYRGSQEQRTPETYSARAVEAIHGDVPDDVRFLVANVDVQKNRFVVQVHGVRPGNPYRLTIVDRFDITKSTRLDDDGDRLPLAPHAYLEDWDMLEHEVMARRYVVREGGRTGTLGIHMTTCDSAGKDGVTANAYAYYRRCKATGLAARFWLTKGAREADAPRARIVTPDSDRKDRNAKARGEIPVLMLNPNILKDQLDGMLLREDAIEFPDWLTPEFYAELCAEVRTHKGWENPRSARNESMDLLYNCIGLLHHMRVDRWDWSKPPAWALPLAGVTWDEVAPAATLIETKSRAWGDFGRVLA